MQSTTPPNHIQKITIAMVGRVNVGKSTLFNRFIRKRTALVAPVPGLTRDRRHRWVSYRGYGFELVDTGGVEFTSKDVFSEDVAQQVDAAVKKAQLIWLVVDGSSGLNPADKELYLTLLKKNKPVHVVVNKADNTSGRDYASEFYDLGTNRVFPVSAMHGTGLDDLLEEAANLYPDMLEKETPPESEKTIRVAFIGRPNVGKSSLVNRLLKDDRMIVSPLAGTTREAVDLAFQFEGQNFELIDTAGIKKKGKTNEYADKLGAVSSLKSLERAHVAILVLDGGEDISEQDCRLAGYIQQANRALVIAVNKWDLVKGGKKVQTEKMADFQSRLEFVGYAIWVQTSALENIGTKRFLKAVLDGYYNFSRKIKTADLNKVIESIVVQHPPPMQAGVKTNIFYGTQVRTAPPKFRILVNRRGKIREDYQRFFGNQLRYHFGFSGSPVEIEWQTRKH
ncbi:MAG: ribosome biogenesis GTPase Der [Deltaproteobacteria bacterium]|nr:ribosome biogenesis GTPase Der [Deltaproteobacteria bacterium]